MLSQMLRDASQIPQMLSRITPGRPPICFSNASYFPDVSPISPRCFPMPPRCIPDESLMFLGCLLPDASTQMFLPRCIIPDASRRCLLLYVSSQMPFRNWLPDAPQLPQMAPNCAQMPWHFRNGACQTKDLFTLRIPSNKER